MPDGSPLAAFLPKIDRDAPKRPLRCRAAIASTLIASLELARDGTVALEQDGDWMPIRLGRHPRAEPVPEGARLRVVPAPTYHLEHLLRRR